MANPKVFNGRIVMKHDTEGNWDLATNFRPLPGELIIYEPDETHPYPRIRVGVAEDLNANPVVGKLLSELPFADEHMEAISIEEIEEMCGIPNLAKVLVDFEYVVNEDGTHTLTGWKGTLNGESSTELVIPNLKEIIV